MPSSLSRLQEVLRDLLAYHPTARLTGGDLFAQVFCEALRRYEIRSIKAHFDGDDAIFTIQACCADQTFHVYDSLRYGLQTFFLSADYGCNPDTQLVHYRLRKVRETCRHGGAAHQALAFSFELA